MTRYSSDYFSILIPVEPESLSVNTPCPGCPITQDFFGDGAGLPMDKSFLSKNRAAD